MLITTVYCFLRFYYYIYEVYDKYVLAKVQSFHENMYRDNIKQIIEYDVKKMCSKTIYKSVYLLDLYNYVFFNKHAGLTWSDLSKYLNSNFIYETSYAKNNVCLFKNDYFKFIDFTKKQFNNIIYIGLNIENDADNIDITAFISVYIRSFKIINAFTVYEIVKLAYLKEYITLDEYLYISNSPNNVILTSLTYSDDLITSTKSNNDIVEFEF